MYANPRKTPSVRQLGPVDISGIREDILAIPEEIWARENLSKPNRFEALEKTQHIVFRFVNGLNDWRGSHDRPMWEDWKSRLEPVLKQATADYGYAHGAFPRIMLARMLPGGTISPHIDASPSAKWPHKIHVPIITNDQVRFFINPSYYHFPVAEAVELNNLDVHAVKNGGDTDRIHLIFEYYDCDQPSWLDE